MNDKIKIIEDNQTKKDVANFNIGDTVKVMTKILEGDKVRLHPFEGTVIAKNGSSIRTTFTVRKVSFGEGIERVFPLYSPAIDKIEVISRGKVKRAKLYYLRAKVGKKTKVASIESQDES